MTVIATSEADTKLQAVLDDVTSSHEPVQIVGKNGNGILIAEEEWQSIQETLYLLGIPGMRESIRQGLATPLEECSPFSI